MLPRRYSVNRTGGRRGYEAVTGKCRPSSQVSRSTLLVINERDVDESQGFKP